MDQIPALRFSPNGFFYQMVSAAGISICGYPLVFNPFVSDKLGPRDYIELKGILGNDRHFFPRDVVELAKQGRISESIYHGTICMMLVNTAFEAVKEFRKASNELKEHPEFEVFRHVRNACSHLNHFNFVDREPARPASWRSLTLDHTLKGANNPMYGKGCFGNVLGTADVFLLLSDMEKILIDRGFHPKRFT
jgi:hypothetical protein